MKSIVIFDLDGTLLNTIFDLGTACNYALEELNLPVHNLKAYEGMVGNGFRKLIERAAPQADDATIERLIKLSRGYYDEHCMEHTHPYPGIEELLSELAGKNIAVAVGSNKYQSAVERIIAHYFPDIPFISIQGQREDRPIKPDPAIINDILEEADVERTNVVMIGDSDVDIETARRAGIDCIAVTWGFSPLNELKESNPNHLVSSVSEIREILKL